MQTLENSKTSASSIHRKPEHLPKIAWVLRHIAFEDLGIFEPLLAKYGFSVQVLDVGVDDFSSLDPAKPDLLFIMGGSIGVYEQDQYPFLASEIEWIRKRIEKKLSTLGICLGSQLIASALGSKVYPGHIKELGWAPVELTPEAQGSYMQPLSEPSPVLHFHGDTFDLPKDAVRLAFTEHYPTQAFAYADHRVLGILFHPEIDPDKIERWLIGHALEISKVKSTSVVTLREDTRKYGQASKAKGTSFFERWLHQVFPSIRAHQPAGLGV